MPNNKTTALIGSLQKFSTEDGPGIRTTIFLKGCPLHCRWCHNPELIRYEQQIIKLPNSCIHCYYCVDHCPAQAISLEMTGSTGKTGSSEMTGSTENTGSTEKTGFPEKVISRANSQIRIDYQKCNLCMECTKFCYAGALRSVAKPMTCEEVMDIVAEDKGFYDHTGGGLTLSGGEMLTHPDFCDEIIRLAEEKEIHVCLDTSGFGDGDRLYAMASKAIVTDILFDMKAIDPELHKEYTGQSNDLILKNLIRLSADPVINPKITMRMPLIHGVNDTEEIIEKTASFYVQHQLKRATLLPYHTLGCSKVRNLGGEPEEFTPPDDRRLDRIRDYLQERGIDVQILGRNVR